MSYEPRFTIRPRLLFLVEAISSRSTASARMLSIVGGLVLMAGLQVGARAAEPRVIELWPEGVPGLKPDWSEEKTVDGRLVNIHKPSMLVFAPDPAKANGTAVVVCSGGGYTRIRVDKNGDSMTRMLTAAGIKVFALKYRLKEYGHPAPLQDVTRAIRIVRARAAEFGVSPNRIGVMGTSAGGHLSACAATLWDSADAKTGAAMDAVSARPDFVAVVYPVVSMAEKFAHRGSREALLGKSPEPALLDALSVEKHVRKDSPPFFIVATMADTTVPVENSLHLYQALRDAGVPAEMHVYAQGSHGNSQDPQFGPTAAWPDRYMEWLRFNGWLAKAP